jgi:RNA recognition motif-containing protein
MTNKLFVGNLSYGLDDNSLKDAFAPAGTVISASIIIDKRTGRSKGFGFVEMSSGEEAQKAVDMLNGQEVDGRAITVSEARPMKPRF